MESKKERNLIQINGDRWRSAFAGFLNEIGKDVDYEDTYPTDDWEHNEWYEDQLKFDEKCGVERCWMNDYLQEDLFGYDIVDEKKFLLAKVKYGF